MSGIKRGVLELTDKGFGFLRNPEANFDAEPEDVYVSGKLISQYHLREGCVILGEHGDARHTGQNPPLESVMSVNEADPVEYKDVWEIRDRIAMDPDSRFVMETGPDDYIGRSIDILCPIGRGQRGLIVAPPKVGKTTVLKHIAFAIKKNHPEVETYGVLIDERPEEVTDFQRTTRAKVFSSSLDEKAEKHIRIAKLAFATAISQAEAGKDVVVLIDSLTRMSRAFNLKTSNRGKVLSGGLDSQALAIPKQFFGAARNFKGKGSLSVLATILVDTGSRMDEVIFQEFKGTGNMELVLDRFLAEKRVWPAINLRQSGTRKEEKLLDNFAAVATIRSKLSSFRDLEAMQEFLGAISKTTCNKDLLDRVRSVR